MTAKEPEPTTRSGIAPAMAPAGSGARPFWRRLAGFIGPGYLVAVGYMDPGNWATSLAAGSRYGFDLILAVFLSSLMAMVLQALAARLAIGRGDDLATACRKALPKPAAIALWVMAEIAIVATDLAEVLGTAIGLELLFGWPLWLGVAVTAIDSLLIIGLNRFGFRAVEAAIVSILILIVICFVGQLALARPDWLAALSGLTPDSRMLTDPDRLYLALGILGATVMPHNLYLHSKIVQTRTFGDTDRERRESLRFAVLDSNSALFFALLVNAAILILAAAVFHAAGRTNIAELSEAHALLAPLLGSALAPKLFALALIACGLNATVTATMAGQVVMEGFLDLRLPAWIGRLGTRLLALIPAAFVAIHGGEAGATGLLVLSQVVLSLQLPFAVIPLVVMTANRRRMGALTAPRGLTLTAGLIAATIVLLNAKLVADYCGFW